MALSVPNYPNPYATTPLTSAYAWITLLILDSENLAGRLKVRVNRDADAGNALLPGVDTIEVKLGEVLAPGVTFPTLQELMADPQFSSAYSYIRGVLYTQLKADPRFAGATDAP